MAAGVVAVATIVGAPAVASESTAQPVVAGELKKTIATGDAAAGKTKAATCAACHGPTGVAAIPTYPNLAGQGAAYLVKQLMEFKSGARDNAVMLGMVAALEPQDMQDLAAYYAEQAPAGGVAESDGFELGENIYRGGITSAGVPACIGCHSPDGNGNDAGRFPALSGQNKGYTVTALQSFRAGTRANDPGKMMRMVAHRLSDTEIAAVANYVQGLH